MIGKNLIVNPKKKQNSISKKVEKIEESPIVIDFRNFMFKSIHTGIFTNFPKDELESFNIQKNFFHQFLPNTIGKTFEELGKESLHNHIIDSDKNKVNVALIRQILKSYSQKFEIEDISDEESILWQLSAPGGMRVIGFRNREVFRVLFLDPHHLIFKSQVFNNDYKNYTYNSENVTYDKFTIVSVDDSILENCFDCKIFNGIMEDKF